MASLQSITNRALSVHRDIKSEMASFMLDRHGGCTREDLLLEFTPKQIDQYGSAAAREANRRAERRFA